jgi:signal transduction histidine kinase
MQKQRSEHDTDPLAIGVGFDVPVGGDTSTAEGTDWERLVDAAFAWLPYVLLGAALVLAQIGDVPPSDRARTIGLSTIAAIWTWLTFTRPGRPTTQGQSSLRVYFAGFVVAATALLVEDPVFLVYAITGFFHASLLRPWPLAFSGIAVTAALVFSGVAIPDGSGVDWAIYLGLIAFQTAAVGFGLYAGNRVTEIADRRRRAIEGLEAARVENEGLHAQLVAQAHEGGVLDERERIAHEMHDTVAQGLAGVIAQIEAVQQNWGDEPEMRRHLANASELARHSLADARRAIHAILPAALDDQRLPDAVRGVAMRWTEVSRIPVDVTTTGEAHPLPVDVEVALLRVAQESLTNIGRHAGASRVGITISFMADAVTLDVRDDGIGFDPSSPRGGPHYGLAVMRERAEALGGSMHIESSPGRGTAVAVTIPTVAGVGPAGGSS